MRNILAVALFTLSLPAAYADSPTEIASASRSIENVLTRLHQSPNAKDKLAALKEINDWSAPIGATDEFLLAVGLEEFIETPTADMGVRNMAVITLGKTAVKLHKSLVCSRMVSFLATLAAADQAMDPRSGLRLAALRALTTLAQVIPDFDDQLAQQVLDPAFKANSSANDQEKLLGVMIIHSYLKGHGSTALYRIWKVSQRIEGQLIAPLEGNLRRIYDSPNANRDYRYFLIRTLGYLGRPGSSIGGTLPHRARQLLVKMSREEPDPSLKRLAARYSGKNPGSFSLTD